MSRNINDALTDVLADIDARGVVVSHRGREHREIRSAFLRIDRPAERVLAIPGRNNSIFAQIAETLWVLAGRDDLEFLSRYLPRATDFSDDGLTWRAAYGPRLRGWDGRVDQIAEVGTLVNRFPNTMRAVISLFDPGADFAETKDVPCNNWLQFIRRDSVLHLNVVVRANDAIWGFSGINFFEWSVLHEVMAVTTGSRVGEITWYVGSMHVYEWHYENARRILRSRGIKSLYEFGIAGEPISARLERFDGEVQQVLAVEGLARAGRTREAAAAALRIEDRFLRSAAVMLRVYNAFLEGQGDRTVVRIVDELPSCDFRIAAIEYFSRRWRRRDAFVLRTEEREYFEYYWAACDANALAAR